MGSLGPRSLLGLSREARDRPNDRRLLAVGGARELVPLLAKELRAGGEADAVVENGTVEEAAALVWLGPADEEVLRRASEADVAIVGVSDGPSIPYVLATNLVVLAPGRGLPVEEITRALARALGPRGVALSARLPVLRGPIVDRLIETCALRNAVLAAAIFIPGADFPVLTLNELRLVIRIIVAKDGAFAFTRLPELVAVLGAGFGSRRIARSLVDFVPAAGFVVKPFVAYSATRAIGEAARTRFGVG